MNVAATKCTLSLRGGGILKKISYQYRNSFYKDKTVSRPFGLIIKYGWDDIIWNCIHSLQPLEAIVLCFLFPPFRSRCNATSTGRPPCCTCHGYYLNMDPYSLYIQATLSNRKFWIWHYFGHWFDDDLNVKIICQGIPVDDVTWSECAADLRGIPKRFEFTGQYVTPYTYKEVIIYSNFVKIILKVRRMQGGLWPVSTAD